jgi:molecular chaperone GrpE
MSDMDSTPRRFHDRRLKYRLRRIRYASDAPSMSLGSAMGGDADVVDVGNASALAGELATAKQELAEANAELDKLREEAKAEILRARAEMENQRRRLQRDRDEFKKVAAADVLQKLMPPIDHFELAVKSFSATADPQSVMTGVELIFGELLSVLEQAGLSRISPLGEKFDPNFHEAIGTAQLADKPANEVVECMRAGYVLSGRVLRPAMVRVNLGVEEVQAEADTEAVAEESPAPQTES